MSAGRRNVIRLVRRVAGGAAAGALLLTAGMDARVSAGETAEPAPTRLVHRFLQIEISPHAAFVASVESESPPNGFYPPIRDLGGRRVRGGAATRIGMPC